MIELGTLTSFIIATFFLALAPGPDNFFVLSESILNGKKTGVIISLGLCSGLIFHSLLVGLGFAAIIKESTVLINTIKYFGVIYLTYLAIMTIKSAKKDINKEGKRKLSYSKVYVKGFFMNILNPKVTIFFLALFPQFLDYKNGNINVQLMILSLSFILTAMLVFSMISIFSSQISSLLLKSETSQKRLNLFVGIVYLSLAAKLLFSDI